MLTAKEIKEEDQLEIDRKKIIEEYIKLGLVEKCVIKDGAIVMKKGEQSDWEWNEHYKIRS